MLSIPVNNKSNRCYLPGAGEGAGLGGGGGVSASVGFGGGTKQSLQYYSRFRNVYMFFSCD
ncbi:MAG: hypothetical protein H7844_04660 [Nitrospirae bacterium YQR-1]